MDDRGLRGGSAITVTNIISGRNHSYVDMVAQRDSGPGGVGGSVGY